MSGLEINSSRSEKLLAARLYVIVDQRLARGSPALLASRITAAGADIVQLRAADIPDREHFRLAIDFVRRVRRASGALAIINNRVDIALESDADGVHLGLTDLPIESARRLLGAGRIIGATTHNTAEARAAARLGADYLSYGPVFATPLKPHLKPRGGSYLQAVRRLELPYFAIGGIDATKIGALKTLGIRRIAVCRAVLEARNPARAVHQLERALLG